MDFSLADTRRPFKGNTLIAKNISNNPDKAVENLAARLNADIKYPTAQLTYSIKTMTALY